MTNSATPLSMLMVWSGLTSTASVRMTSDSPMPPHNHLRRRQMAQKGIAICPASAQVSDMSGLIAIEMP